MFGFISWEQMTELQQLETIYCDMHKDVYGVKARGYHAESVEQARIDVERLKEALVRVENTRKEEEQRAISVFCKRLEHMIRSGAPGWKAALRWIHEADGTNGDDEYLCHINGLPAGFFKQAA